MKEETITVTEAARNFAECVNRSHYQNTTFVLLKNGKPVAKLVPAEKDRCTGRDLAEAMGKVKLTSEEARQWRNDIKNARKNLKSPADKWQ